MARKTVRVEIPKSRPEGMIKLALEIKRRHERLPANSPLKAAQVQAMGDRAEAARSRRIQAEEMEARARLLREEADSLIGIAPGQSSETLNTLLHDVTGFRDALLLEHRGTEQALRDYGFEVFIGTAAAAMRVVAVKPAGTSL